MPMPISVKSSHYNRQNETATESPRANPTNNFHILKVQYENRVEGCKYCPRTTTTSDLETYIRQTFDIAANRTFRLIGEDDLVFILTPIDFDNDEIFRLEIDPEKSVSTTASTPPMQPRHNWKYYGKILLSKIRRIRLQTIS